MTLSADLSDLLGKVTELEKELDALREYKRNMAAALKEDQPKWVYLKNLEAAVGAYCTEVGTHRLFEWESGRRLVEAWGRKG